MRPRPSRPRPVLAPERCTCPDTACPWLRTGLCPAPTTSWRTWERRRSRPPSWHTRAVPPAKAPRSHRWEARPHAPLEASARYRSPSSHPRFLLGRGTCAPRLIEFEVTLLVKLRDFVGHSMGQKLTPHDHQQTVVACAVVDQRLHQLGRHQRGVAGLLERVLKQFHELLA